MVAQKHKILLDIRVSVPSITSTLRSAAHVTRNRRPAKLRTESTLGQLVSTMLFELLSVALFISCCLVSVNGAVVMTSSCGNVSPVNRSTDSITVNCSEVLQTYVSDKCTTQNGTRSSSTAEDNVILLGFLLPRIHGGNFMLGAIPCAVFSVNDNPNLLSNYTLKFCAEAAGVPGTSQVMRKMTGMKNHNVRVIIGPDESCMSEALLAAAWELPMLSYKCSDKHVSDKSRFPTFARTMPPSSKVCKFLVALLKHYHWDNIVIVAGNKPSWNQIVEALVDFARNEKIVVADIKYIAAYYTSVDDYGNFCRTIDETYKITRVFVFIGDNDALVDFARYLQHLGQKGELKTGEYVIISVDDEINTHRDASQYVVKIYEDEKSLTYENMSAFRSVLKLTALPPINENFSLFLNETRYLSRSKPFNVPYSEKMFSMAQVPIYAAHVYDAVKVYAEAMDEVIRDGEDVNNATNIMARIFNKNYQSVQGFTVNIDENGDAEGNYTILGLVHNSSSPTKFSIQRVAGFINQIHNRIPNVVEEQQIAWIDGKPPVSKPTCGFDDTECNDWWKITAICIILVIIIIAAIFIVRRYHYEYKLALLLWKIDYKDIILLTNDMLYQSSHPSNGTTNVTRASFLGSIPLENPAEHAALKKPYARIGSYKGMVVAIKPIPKRNFDLTRNVRKELKSIRELRHDNINAFIGACIDDSPSVCIVTAYCARGSLEDVLQNKDLHLDNMFISSLVADLIRGMMYLHDSEKVSHGNLKSSNCLVDSRWVLQIADFGLNEFKGSQEMESPEKSNKYYNKGLLFRAPELLRVSNSPSQGTYKGDVYAFGIVLHHLIYREGPWGYNDIGTKFIVEIIKRVKNPEHYNNKSCRPGTKMLQCSPLIKKCISLCWNEDPDRRPDFRSIRAMLKEMQAGLKPNIFDNMMAIMEKYAYNLEGVVQERTNQLMEEKKKTETLLHRMLPKSVAESLKRGERVKAESFDMVTIYFSDIVGFTALSAESTPLQVVDLLNDLYTCFDSIIGNFDVYKVETIGDAYMVASGLPIRNEDKHAGEIASMALALLRKIKNFQITHRPGETLKLRIGIHSGPCVAGVVGLKMPRYCLFGDTVNTASRMESTGEALKIHVSEACKTILDKLGGFFLVERGLINVKGKGEMRTFWLKGEEPSRRPSRENHVEVPMAEVSKETSPCVEQSCVENDSEEGDEWTTIVDCSGDFETSSSPASSLPGSPLLPVRHTKSKRGIMPRNPSEPTKRNPRSHQSNNNKLLLKKCCNGGDGGGGHYISCSNVFEDNTDNIAKDMKKNGHAMLDKYYSAPTMVGQNENFV